MTLLPANISDLVKRPPTDNAYTILKSRVLAHTLTPVQKEVVPQVTKKTVVPKKPVVPKMPVQKAAKILVMPEDAATMDAEAWLKWLKGPVPKKVVVPKMPVQEAAKILVMPKMPVQRAAKILVVPQMPKKTVVP